MIIIIFARVFTDRCSNVSIYERHEKTDDYQEEFEDTKGVIRIRKSKKDRQLNGQTKKYKGINNDLQNITQRNKDWATRILLKTRVNSGASEE